MDRAADVEMNTSASDQPPQPWTHQPNASTMTSTSPMPLPVPSPDPLGDDDPALADLIPADDPYVLAEVARALGPYEGKLAPEVFEAMRANLILALTTHPVGARLVAAARTAPANERSGTRKKG
jgi:hypothetical protein